MKIYLLILFYEIIFILKNDKIHFNKYSKTKMSKFKIKDFNNLEEFFPFYLSQHRNNFNRLLHIVGTLLANLIFVLSLLTGNYKYTTIAPIVGYGFAWIGHFCFEKNRPATFGHAKYSFLSDYKMVYEILSGNIINVFRQYYIENIAYLKSDLF